MSDYARGLTWSPQWSSPGESAYTRLGKMSIANPWPLDDLQRLLMGTRCTWDDNLSGHSRTLLSNQWMIAARAHERCDWSRALTEATLDPVLGDWMLRLASDRVLRYCPSCLAQGFHSPLCQIEGLEVCPAHGDTLRNTCGHCDAPMPRYAWDRAFSHIHSPMHCKQCGQPFGQAWAVASHLKWRPMPGAELYGKLTLELAAARDIGFGSSRAWDEGLKWIDRALRRRYEYALVQGALQRSAGERSAVASAHIEEWLELPRAGEIDDVDGASAQATLCRAYEQTLRRIARATKRKGESALTWSQSYSGLLEPDHFRDPDTVAAYLFRCRFASATHPPSPLRRSSNYRLNVEMLAEFFDLDLRRWKHVFAACHRAELRFALLMRDRTAGLSRGSPAWRQTLAYHDAGLSRATLLPPGAAMLSVPRADQGSGILAFARLPGATEYP